MAETSIWHIDIELRARARGLAPLLKEASAALSGLKSVLSGLGTTKGLPSLASGMKSLAEARGGAAKIGAVYDGWLAKMADIYARDAAQYGHHERRKVEAAREAGEDIAAAQERAAEQTQAEWGQAFERLGGDLESALDQAIFNPPVERRWFSQSAGPGGVPLLTEHMISPMQQVMWSLERKLSEQAFNSVLSGVGKSFSQSLFGTSDLGSGLAKLIGIGTPGGLFGTGIGAVQTTALAANTTALGALTVAVTGLTAAMGASTGVSAASGGANALSAAGNVGGLLGGLKTIGGFIFGLFEKGGIVPSAAGGWALPDFSGGTPAILHSREMVLPRDISEGLQGMIREGAGPGPGGDVHLHFHGPADAASISSWFAQMVGDNPAPFLRALRGTAFSLA